MQEIQTSSIRARVMNAIRHSSTSSPKSSETLWKPVAGYEDSYEVNEDGTVRRLPYDVIRVSNEYTSYKENVLHLDHKLLHPYYYRGRPFVSLRKNGVTRPHALDRIVAIAFLDNPKQYRHLIHKDRDCRNNKVSNLKWCSIREYQQHYNTKSDE